MSITIDDKVYTHINVVNVIRKAEFLYKGNAKRTLDGKLHLELVGVYYNFDLEFAAPRNATELEEYQTFWSDVTQPTPFHKVVVPGDPDDGGDYEFWAYYAGVSDELRRQHNSSNYWKGLKMSFIAESPARS